MGFCSIGAIVCSSTLAMYASREPSCREIRFSDAPPLHCLYPEAKCVVRSVFRWMKLLPNFDHAVVSIEKLEEYVLNDAHPQGKHKARVFRSVLNIEQSHAAVLADLLRKSLIRAPAEQSESNLYGDRWTTWHEIIGLNGESAVVTVAWMFKRNAEQIPVLISCYIDTGNQGTLKKRVERG
jgi:hypothetical protein